MVFTSFTSSVKQVKGKEEYLQSTKRFYDGIVTLEIKTLLVVSDRALTRYQLQRPELRAFECNVGEIFRVRDGKVVSFEICFDSAPFPK